MFERVSKFLVTALGISLCLFTLFEVNYNQFQSQSALAIFVGLGMMMCFLQFPLDKRWKDVAPLRWFDLFLALAAGGCCLYMVIQNEPFFRDYWSNGASIGNRAGDETKLDFVVGLIGLVLVLEATRRSIGWIVPVMALSLVAHTYYCHLSYDFDFPRLPQWMLPHAGQDMTGIVATTFLQEVGVFGQPATVMFKYVLLFVVFGSFLDMFGATQFIVDLATKTLGRFRGGPAMISVMASGLMGSLSGSAVANAMTTGTFTIPMMRKAKFPNHIAGGITAASASGGALVPPVMGAGAYLMLEYVAPKGGFVTIMKAAIIPALLYYFSILAIVYLYSRKLGTEAVTEDELQQKRLSAFEATVFFGALGVLIGLLCLGFSAFRSVTGSLAVILVLAIWRKELKLGFYPRLMAFVSFFAVLLLHQATIFVADAAPGWLANFLGSSWLIPGEGTLSLTLTIESILGSAIVGMFGLIAFGLIHPAWRPEIMHSLVKSAKNGISLVAASACVGVIVGIVMQTGMAGDFSDAIGSVVETNLFLALLGIMVCSLILGMGVPSVVCYVLIVTLMATLLERLGVIPLAAHLFIFYFGMMSMVTPPVALAGYASASIAEAPVMKTSLAAFRFSLVGFTLPFMFIYRPALLLMSKTGGDPTLFAVVHATLAAVIGIVSLAAGLTGYLLTNLGIWGRISMFVAALLLLAPITQIGEWNVGLTVDLVGAAVLAVTAFINWQFSSQANVKPLPADV